jgi:biotin carboxyl carrier protein
VAGLILVVVAGGVIYAYRSHATSNAAESDAPVVAPSRLQQERGEVSIRLDSAGMRNAGLTLAALRAGAEAGQIELRGEVVVDPDATTIVRAPVSGRLAVVEEHRWPAYGDQLATGDEVATVSDARAITVPRGGTVTRVLARAGAIVQAGDPLLEITDFERPVVRVSWSDDAPPAPTGSIRVLAPDAAAVHLATLIGPAPEADPVTRRAAYLYRLDRAWAAARPGYLVRAMVPTAGQGIRGVVIPTAAVVQWDGLEWAWLRRDAGRFIRVRVPTDRPLTDGWLAGPPWKAGDSVVVKGAEQLLSEEFRARVTVGDEVAE